MRRVQAGTGEAGGCDGVLGGQSLSLAAAGSGALAEAGLGTAGCAQQSSIARHRPGPERCRTPEVSPELLLCCWEGRRMVAC